VEGVATDARFLAVRESGSPGTVSLWMVDGTRAEVAGQLTVAAAQLVPDLHVTGAPDGPHVVSSRPADALRVSISGMHATTPGWGSWVRTAKG
jgi:hypothetical protein